MVIGIPSLATSNVILFYVGISVLEKKSPFYIGTAHILPLAAILGKKNDMNEQEQSVAA
jgi:hypothetical protein